jgi:hypothetical protein
VDEETKKSLKQYEATDKCKRGTEKVTMMDIVLVLFIIVWKT